MRALRIESGGKIFIDGELADITKLSNKEEFLTSLLCLDTELGDNVSCLDLIHLFYDSKDIIQSMLSEEYEVVRALVSATHLPKKYKSIKVYKSFKIEKELGENEDFIYMIPEIEFIPAINDENGIKNIGGLSVCIDEDITLKHNGLMLVQAKTKITLLELLICLFDDLPSIIKDGRLLLSQ